MSRQLCHMQYAMDQMIEMAGDLAPFHVLDERLVPVLRSGRDSLGVALRVLTDTAENTRLNVSPSGERS